MYSASTESSENLENTPQDAQKKLNLAEQKFFGTRLVDKNTQEAFVLFNQVIAMQGANPETIATAKNYLAMTYQQGRDIIDPDLLKALRLYQEVERMDKNAVHAAIIQWAKNGIESIEKALNTSFTQAINTATIPTTITPPLLADKDGSIAALAASSSLSYATAEDNFPDISGLEISQSSYEQATRKTLQYDSKKGFTSR